jgi:nucleoside phosphorylase/transcription elongation GreA/GreB family factor
MTQESGTAAESIQEAAPLRYRAVILTALGLEYNAVLSYLTNPEKKVHPDGSIYEIGTITLNNFNWEVTLVETGAHNISAAKETERALATFNPNIVLFLGVAGGLKDVSIGDVVSSTKVYGYESGKAEVDFHPRPEVFTPNNLMIHLSRLIVREGKWVKRLNLSLQQKIPKALIGAIVAGEKVIASKESKEYKEIKDTYGDALAVEMEGLGFMQVAADHRDIDALLIRGISDLIEKKSESDASGSQENAVKNASAFAIEVLANYGLIKKSSGEGLEIFTRIPINKAQVTQYSGQSSKGIRTGLSDDTAQIATPDIIDEQLGTEYNAELNNIKKLLDEFNPTTALSLLYSLKDRTSMRASNEVKFRILTNEAVANIQLLKFSEGGKLLIQALQYNPDNEKALGNVAFGYLLNKNYEKSLEYAHVVLQKNPLSARAYSVIIQSRIPSESIDTILPSLPQEVTNTQDVAEAIGQIYYNAENFVESSKWLKIALANSVTKEDLFLKGLLASSILNCVKSNEKTLDGLQISDEPRQLLLESISLFDEAWSRISADPNLQKLHSSWIAERGVAKRILGLINESSKDINEAYDLEPKNPRYIHLKGLLEFELGHPSVAESLLKQVIWDPSTPGALWMYLNSLRKQNKSDEGIKNITDFLRESRSKEQESVLYHFLIVFNIDKGKDFFPEAKSIAQSQHEKNENDIAKVVELVKVLQFIGENDKIEQFIQTIKELYSESIPALQKLEIADIFLNSRHFDDSATIYESVIDPTQNTPFTQKLIDAYYLGGNHKRALELCRSLHAIYGPLPHSSTIELAIYHKIGDLIQAANVCAQYLKLHPEDYEMKLNEAIVNLRSDNTDKVIEFLKTRPQYENLAYGVGAKLAHLYYSMGMFDDAIQLAYDLRYRNYHRPEAHLDYIHLIVNIEDRSPILTKPSTIGIDSAVQLVDRFGKTSQYIICDTSVKDPEKYELRMDSDLGKQLLGKTEGESIFLQKTSFVENTVQITSILSKYIYAFQDSTNNFNQLFPSSSGIYRIPFGTGPDGKLVPEDIQNLKKMVSQNQQHTSSILDYYKKRQFTIAAVAEAIRADIFSVCAYLSNDSTLGIFCSSGNANERDDALKNLKPDFKLIIDPVALHTVYSLGIGDIIVKKYGKFGITQSTVDLIHGAILNYGGQKARGYLTLFQVGDNLGYVPTSPDQINKARENLEKMLEWVRSNCEIIPCYPALNLKSTKKEEYNNLFGEASIDTILVASQPNNILFSDDGLLQAIAKQLYSSSCVWTQILLMDLSSSSTITSDQLEEISIQLVMRHYFHTSVNSNVLVKAANLAEWDIKTPFIEVLECLKEGKSDIDSSTNVGIQFTELLWRKPLEIDSRNYLLVKLLHDLTVQRDKSYIINRFNQSIFHSPRLSSQQKYDILDTIELFDSALS